MCEVKKTTFCTYNLRGYDKVAAETIKQIMPNCSFLLLQETWNYEQEFIINFKKDFKKFSYDCISANKNDLRELKVGSVKSGISICYHTNSNCIIETISTKSKCFCAQKLKIGPISILLINAYMPSSNDRDSLDEYSQILLEISSVCKYNTTDFIIMGGDWNADPSRTDGKTFLFKEFLKNENLYNALETDIADVPYTYMCKDQIGNRVGSTSKIDHFIISPSLKSSIREYKTLSKFSNASDHVPLVLTVDIDMQLHKTHERDFKPSVAWQKCDDIIIAAYKDKLDQNLLQIDPTHEAWNCKDFKCTKHYEYIQNVHNNIIGLWLEASNSSLPHTSNNEKRGIIPGWNEHVKDRKKYAKECHDAWIRDGKPRQGDIAKEKRISRLRYHYAIRYVTKENIRLRNIKMGEAVANNNDRCLWDEARKMSKETNKLPTMMDGITDEVEISNIFSDKYKTLYNSVGYSKRNMDTLRKEIEAKISNGCASNPEQSDHSHLIMIKEVKNAIDMLKNDKKEENGLNSNHLKHASDRLVVIITLLFNCMLSHGMAPDELLLGTMIPLIKNSRGKKHCSDNYRALTIGTGLSKLLDVVIRNKQTDALKTSDLQFGFKEKSSTSMCTFAVVETIEYYKSSGSNVHVLLLDASKAFDRVNYIKLFEKMLKKGMCPLTVRLLLNMYTEQKLQVKWNKLLTDKFNVTNGVRQGGVLSPLFYSIYVDDLLEKLKENGIGCHIGHHYVGVFGYADDIILLCPSVTGLIKMIKICEEYANEHDILFNGKKSKYLVFGKAGRYKYNHTVKVNNEIVVRCEKADHLGHPLQTENTLDALAEKGLNNLNTSFHGFMSRFRGCNSTTRNKLFHQYCSSMYGSQLWLLDSNGVDKILSKWRKYHRVVLEVPCMTHSDMLPLISDRMPLECTLDLKYISFYKSIAASKNVILKYMAKHMLQSHSSTMCRNMRHLCYKYDLRIDNILASSIGSTRKEVYNKWFSSVNESYPIHAKVVKDMLGIKEERYTRILSNDDCNLVIEFLCTL